ncbi:MAG: hypothetical protein KKD44_03055 [Proteobacteria bacterium]|nr:hypothetical protein [Pseudomonadota bacterium]
MAQAKKYGAFSGVFTPSILTILGVIMYMRLPWIVGQSGLYMVLGIVLVAHIVSICTGLSVSSIATDKKVEGGGSYYIISRSLGLPIGGTLGIALFFGLSFSVSLYIIGFSESFNAYWGIESSINAIRLTGSIVLLLVTILTFISTSLAMRLQFFILGAIALSLVSVLFGHSAYVPDKITLLPQATAPSMMVLFGIFFPAVTGFEAGVSMSGDLKDAKRSIPIGTIASILVGLGVYMSLPVFLLYRVDANTLITNPNVLLEISLVPQLVIAGIWAATISSAIGSILGAPRILQATAVDNITPRFFAKGHGKQNEPRNAILITFMIAEAGILIGELDIIARIVSTFFITTYGFLNLSCAVERWASSDFRPSFKVPKWVSILGFLTCLIVMIQLDLLAMIGGILILGGLLFFLKSRELTLKSGDAWESVWLSIVRMGLFKLSQSGRHQRNWKPNILLFSGGTVARPHLIEFGRWTAGQLGMVSNFDLIETPSAKVLFPKSSQTVISDDEAFEGVFIRRQECRDVYEGINTIARTYGFSGIEPNAVLMGWRKKTKDPEQFLQLLKNLKELDYNLMLMNYHDQKGFGGCNTIDIWWRGAGRNGNFTLAMVKFILASLPWRDARPRFLIVTHESSRIETIYKNMTRTLQDARLDGDIKVINNAAEQRPFEDIISVESAASDLTILGLPDMLHQNASAAVENTNRILSRLGTTLLVQASSFFDNVVTGIEYESKKDMALLGDDGLSNLGNQNFDLPAISLTDDDHLKSLVTNLDQFVITLIFQSMERYFSAVHERNRTLLKSLGDLAANVCDRIDGLVIESGSLKARRSIAKMQGDLFFQFIRVISEFRQSAMGHQKDMLEEAVQSITSRLDDHWKNLPESVIVLHSPENIQAHPGDRLALKCFKWFKRLEHRWGKKKNPSVSVHFRQLVQASWDHLVWEKWNTQFQQMALHHHVWGQDIQGALKSIKDRMDWAENRFLDGQLTPENVSEMKQDTQAAIDRIQTFNDNIFFEFIQNLLQDERQFANQVSQDAGSIDAAFFLRQHVKHMPMGKQAKLSINDFPRVWLNNQALFVDVILMDLSLMAFQRRLSIILQRIKQDWFLSLENGLHDKIERLIDDAKEGLSPSDEETERKIKLQFEVKPNLIPEHAVKFIADEIQPAFEAIPESAQAITELSLQQMQDGHFTEMEGMSVDLRELLEYFVYAELLDPLRQHFTGIQAEIESIVSRVKEAVRFLSFNLSSPEFSGEIQGDNGGQSIVNQTVGRIETEKESVTDLQQELMDIIDKGLKLFTEKINPYLIIQSSGELRRYIRYQESKKVISIFGKKGRRVETWAQSILIKWVYKQKQMITATHGPETTSHKEPCVKDILAWLETVSPKKRVLEDLPFHYKQLFLSEQPPSKDFWVGRQDELARAQIAVDRFKAGVSGALMVTGERFSGKRTLSHFIAQQFFDSQSVFQIFPPADGSCSLDTFHQSMETALQVRGDIRYLFLQIPSQSVIVFHNLELWWERHPQGSAIMNHLEWMIREFGHQCFFIFNMNTHALALIRNLQKIDDYLLDVIECRPMTPEELKTMILMRHKATGLIFTYGHHTEETISELNLARMFRRFYDYSKGNPGVALHAWISHIDQVQGDTVQMATSFLPDLTKLSHLPMDWMVVILQFVLHKTLNRPRLMRLMGWEEPPCRRIIDVLQRAGILEAHGDNRWSINPYAESFLIDQLRARKIL